MSIIKSITLTVNNFGAIEVVATLEAKKTVGLLVIGTYNEGCTRYSAISADLKGNAHNMYSTWDFENCTQDPILRRLFIMAYNHIESDAMERRIAEQKAEEAAEAAAADRNDIL